MTDPTLFYGRLGLLPASLQGSLVIAPDRGGRGVVVEFWAPREGIEGYAHVDFGSGSLPYPFSTLRLDLSPAPEGEPPPSIAPALHLAGEMLGWGVSSQPPRLREMRRGKVWLLGAADGRNACFFGEGSSCNDDDREVSFAAIPAGWSDDLRERRSLVRILEALATAGVHCGSLP